MVMKNTSGNGGVRMISFVIHPILQRGGFRCISNMYLKCKNSIKYTKKVFRLKPLTPNIKEQILLSCPNTSLIKVLGRSYKISREFILGDYILNSHDLTGQEPMTS